MNAAVVLVCLFLGYTQAESPLLSQRSNLDYLRDDSNLSPLTSYRLLDTVQPNFYFVDLDVYLDERRFDGIVSMRVQILTANLTQVVLHSNVESITAVTVSNYQTDIISPLDASNPLEFDDYFELMKINFAEPQEVGTYLFEISYRGIINENPFDRGFYLGYYFYNGEKRYYATTQFQPFHARKAFPCFDEPQFKSQFVIAITRSANLSESYSNMPIAYRATLANGRIRETFALTPIISTYLIAFHVSDFIETDVGSQVGRPIGIVSRVGSNNQHQYAGQSAQAITTWLENYLGFNYYTMGVNGMKNDHIALPDFPSGAMENWGMVNYREAYLLYDEQNTNINNQIFIATIISHEMAHKWFGNLVTCYWWSNLWLNESFASFFEYFATHGVYPELELDDQFVVDYVHSALLGDANGASAMNLPTVDSNPSISNHFSTSSYAKGASVLRMMEHFVGPSTFQKALNKYLTANQYQLGTPELMYEAFEEAVTEDAESLSDISGANVTAVFQSWVDQAGAPVLDVEVNMDTGLITLTQSKFWMNDAQTDELWQIPLTYTRQNDINWENVKPTALMTTRATGIQKPAGEEWVIFNVAQSGYYRVNYDERTWRLIAEALRTNRESIHKLNRAQIVNDVLVYVRAGRIDISLAFDIINFLKDETDYYVWVAAITPMDWIRRRLTHMPVLLEQFHAYLSEQMETVINHLGFDERENDSTSTKLNRLIIMNYACNVLEHQACRADALQKWQAYRANENQLVPKNLRRHVYCVGISEGDNTDYQFLWNKYRESENTADMVVILRALGCTRDSATLLDYLQESMTSDYVRAHDKTNSLSYALLGHRDNIKTVLEFFYSNYNDIRTYYGGTSRLATALSTLSTYLYDYEDVIAFQSWLYSNQVALSDVFSTGVSVVNSATTGIVWGNNAALDLRSYLNSWNSAATPFLSITLLLSAIAAYLLQ